MECMWKRAIEVCNCVHWTLLSNYPDINICDSLNMKCFEGIITQHPQVRKRDIEIADINVDWKEKCQLECPADCEETIYSLNLIR